ARRRARSGRSCCRPPARCRRYRGGASRPGGRDPGAAAASTATSPDGPARTWAPGARTPPPTGRRRAPPETSPFHSRLLPLCLTRLGARRRQHSLDRIPIDLDRDLRRDLDRDDLLAERGHAAVRPAAQHHLVVALQAVDHRLRLAAALLLGTPEQ